METSLTIFSNFDLFTFYSLQVLKICSQSLLLDWPLQIIRYKYFGRFVEFLKTLADMFASYFLPQ